jgi:hypothetical protein
MGYIDMDRDSLTGKNMTVDDMVISWDDEEAVWLQESELDAPEPAPEPKHQNGAVPKK